MFHTSRWDYDYTGGDTYGGLTGLADKRVAIIGTGATAVQCVPHLADSAKELFVFQRTPSSVDVRDNAPTDTDWFESLEPGWQKRYMENFTALGRAMTSQKISLAMVGPRSSEGSPVSQQKMHLGDSVAVLSRERKRR